MDADAVSTGTVFLHLQANRWGYCDWCHPDICKSSSRLSQETACDIMLPQMSPECARRSHVTCRDLEWSGAPLGTCGSVGGWRVQQITGFCSIRQVLCSIFLCNTLCRHWGFGFYYSPSAWWNKTCQFFWRAAWWEWPLYSRMVGSQGANIDLSGASFSLTCIDFMCAHKY